MKIKIIVAIVVLALVAAGVYFSAGYGAYFDAQAACQRASDGRPAGQALSHLNEIARKRGAQVVQSGEWTTAVFRSLVGAGYACGIRLADGKLVEFRVAATGEIAQKK